MQTQVTINSLAVQFDFELPVGPDSFGVGALDGDPVLLIACQCGHDCGKLQVFSRQAVVDFFTGYIEDGRFADDGVTSVDEFFDHPEVAQWIYGAGYVDALDHIPAASIAASALAKGYEIHVYELHLTVRAVKRELRAMARKTMEIMAMARMLSRVVVDLDPLAEAEAETEVAGDGPFGNPFGGLAAALGGMSGAVVLSPDELEKFLAGLVGEDSDPDAAEETLDPDLESDVPEGE